jgi:hypothetical protein
LIFGKALRDEARMEERASQLIALIAHCDVSAGQTQPHSRRRNWRSLLPPFELFRVLVGLDHVASFIKNANHSVM